jgi:hypothetical protein
MTAFWDIAPCRPVKVDQRFRDDYCLIVIATLTTKAERTSETSVYFGRLRGAIFQKAVIFIPAAVRTPNLTGLFVFCLFFTFEYYE